MDKRRQHIEATNDSDSDGNPYGGTVRGPGLDIVWQKGPLAPGDEPNGAFVQSVIQAAIQRLEYYQGSKFRCRENALALAKLEEAMHWLDSRTASRASAGLEGGHGVRPSEGAASD